MRGRWRPGHVGRPDRCRVDGPVQPASRSTPPHSAVLRESSRQRASAGRLPRFVPPAEWRNDRKRRPGSAPRRDADRWPSTRSESGRRCSPRKRSRTTRTPAMPVVGVSVLPDGLAVVTRAVRLVQLLPGPDSSRVLVARPGMRWLSCCSPVSSLFPGYLPPRFFVTTNRQTTASFMDDGRKNFDDSARRVAES